MKITKHHFFAPLLLCGALNAQAVEFQVATGIGTQYGFLGAQLNAIEGDTKYYVSAGILGAGLGFSTAFSDDKKVAVGAVVSRFFGIFGSHTDIAGLTLNYRANGFASRGWDFGIGVGYYERTENSWSSGDRFESGAALTFNVGYAF
ncbi:hypothetical protein [Pseudoalteromonas sp. R3]|uniref:hypothetical protein n=1 Tax=Pseudoalteromonas sp. R3 TaxID=1709477 RepID=UPI0006B6894D|nr:hypothetical protein [Pseudoalteromonas sp. R3]AZZ98858.1 hypothetical protein ELR70_18180 [Pseudoalteromonas sp. R3]